MRLLCVANTAPDPYQGASGADLSTIHALRELGHGVDTVWAPDMRRWIRDENLHQLFELPRNFASAVAKRCLRVSYDVVQVNQPYAYLAAREHRRLGRPGLFVNRSHGWEPHVREVVQHDLHGRPRSSNPWWRRIGSNVLWRFIRRQSEKVAHDSDGMVVCSVDDRDYLIQREKIAPEKVLALAPGISGDFLTTAVAQDHPARFRRILYVAQFSPHKRPDLVAKVINGLFAKRLDLEMTWVCKWWHHDQVRESLSPLARERVTLLDWMPRSDLRRVYDEHGIFLFPSDFEGYSLAFLEAMARGLCVFASRIDGMRQAIQDGVNGFVFERGNADGMIERVLALLADPAQCEEISRKARQTAVCYTWERTARELIGFFEQLLSRKAAQFRRTA